MNLRGLPVQLWPDPLPKLHDLARGGPLLVLGLAATAIVFVLNPAKLGLMLWGCARIAVYAWIGYWVDRLLFPYARPHMLEGVAEGTAWKRRAVIVSAAILAGALLP